VNELRDFVKRLPQFQSEHEALRLHTNIAEKILSITKEKGFHKRLEAEQSRPLLLLPCFLLLLLLF
jgi:hypothetical protein